MSVLDAILGGTLITGVERDPDYPEYVRVYVGHRGEWNYVLAESEEAERVEAAWGSTAKHLFTRLDPGTPVYHDAEGKAAAKARQEEVSTDR